MVAFRFRAYKAPHHFVFFGDDRNDNNTEIPAAGGGRAGTGRHGTGARTHLARPRIRPGRTSYQRR